MVLPTCVTWQYVKFDDQRELLFWSWVWCSVYVVTLGLIMLRRFNGGRWKTMTVIEPPME